VADLAWGTGVRGMSRGRTQAERDAVTVEMLYAAVTGALIAAAGFVAVITPVLCGAVHGEARKGCFTAAVIVAAALFCGRIALTLRRFERQNRLRGQELTPDQLIRPSQPSGPVQPARADRSATAEAAAPDAPPRVPNQRRADRGGADGDSGGPSDQPSQPGRTNPDS
jgi:Family of unknown function (DUF6332)